MFTTATATCVMQALNAPSNAKLNANMPTTTCQTERTTTCQDVHHGMLLHIPDLGNSPGHRFWMSWWGHVKRQELELGVHSNAFLLRCCTGAAAGFAAGIWIPMALQPRCKLHSSAQISNESNPSVYCTIALPQTQLRPTCSYPG